jgi:hypothetical protein
MPWRKKSLRRAGGDQAKTANDGNEHEGMIRKNSYRFSE